MLKQSFAPIIPSEPRILILGSLPGDLSIAKNQYYAHPQNRFWKLLFALFEQEYSSIYTVQINLLQQNQIALWDVCASALRPGSMDTAISEVIPNNIPNLIARLPHLRIIAFNGQKAEKLHDKYFQRLPDLEYLTLPSTSPANAQFKIERLIDYWKSLIII